MVEERLQQILESLPSSPGVYLMKNSRGKVIYVGKAKSLRSRVRSYFSTAASDDRIFFSHLVRAVDDIEVVLTASEKEALLLENNLIKKHNPKFNIRLRDDKEFLSLRFDLRAEWPRLEIVRRPSKDTALYFGPYHSATSARETVKLMGRFFKLRTCNDRYMKSRTRPCLQYEIHRCWAPCVFDVDKEAYGAEVKYVRLFLAGRHEELLKSLEDKMNAAAAGFEYEQAALFRDQIRAIESTLAPQRITTFKDVNQDVIGMHREGDQVEITILEVRGGRMADRLGFYFSGQEFPDKEVLSSFIKQKYLGSELTPDEIIVSRPLEDTAVLVDVLSEIKGKKVQVLCPQKGPRAEQVKMADRNAAQALEIRLKDRDAIEERLTNLQKKLKLPSLPRRIECVDISHLGGTDTVGAISAVVDGQASRKDGRTYRLPGIEGGDDYKAMHEVVARRFIRAQNDEEGWQAPDLFVVDGGRGQLAVALAVFEDLGITNQAIVALAKERGPHLPSEEALETDRVYLPGRKNPIPLRAATTPLMLLALARDEAHRLAGIYQKKLRKKRSFASELDKVAGVGDKTKKALLKKIGSVKKIRQASVEELMQVEGVGAKMAERIKDALN